MKKKEKKFNNKGLDHLANMIKFKINFFAFENFSPLNIQINFKN